MPATPSQSPQHGSVIHPTVLSFDADAAVVDATRTVITEMRADGFTPEETATEAAAFLADQVAAFHTHADYRAGDWYATNQEHAEHDPSDSELAQSWNAPDAPAAHRAAWALHQETHDRSAS